MSASLLAVCVRARPRVCRAILERESAAVRAADDAGVRPLLPLPPTSWTHFRTRVLYLQRKLLMQRLVATGFL